jgi:hypothetical protein
MAKTSNNNNLSLSASELVRVLTETITQTFVNLGIVQVIAHPTSVPNVVPTQAQVTKPVIVPTVTTPKTHTPHSSGNEPNFGDGSCIVGENRTKLPKGIFDGYEGIVLRFPDGHEHGIKTDSEGRGRLTLNQTNEIGAYHSQGHHLVFIRDIEYGNVYDVVIWSGEGYTVYHPENGGAYAQQPVAETPAVNKAKAKKPATPAQLAARAEFSRKAKEGTLRKGNTQAQPVQPTLYRVSDEAIRVTDEDFEDDVRTIVAAPGVSQVRVRPIYAVPVRKAGR